MSTATQILTAYGMANADALVSAASIEGLPLHIAAAFASKESGGQNIYGHDSGGVFSYPGTNVAVTQANFADFYNQVVNLHRTSNGVGPMQITYPGFFPVAASRGLRLWVPLDNFRFGFKIIHDYLGGNYSDAKINDAGQRYNSGRSGGAPQYGADVVSLAHTWSTRLIGAVVNPTPIPPHPVVKAPKFPLPAGYYFGDKSGPYNSISGFYSYKGALTPWQTQMGHRGWSINLDGHYAGRTPGVVLAFQKEKHLTPDGQIGPLTWAAAWTAPITK
jgi:hypothetical protein